MTMRNVENAPPLLPKNEVDTKGGEFNKDPIGDRIKVKHGSEKKSEGCEVPARYQEGNGRNTGC